MRAVFFDLGGTLVSNRDIAQVNTPVLLEAARRLDVEADLAQAGLTYLRASRRANDACLKRRFYLHRDLFLDTYRHFAEILGRTASPDFLDWFYHAQRKVMVEGLTLREDCIETLRALRDQGLDLSIVSNVDYDYLDPMIENLGLAPFFDHLTSSEEARACKPDPEIFRFALRRAGYSVGDVIFVGDSRVHDIQGANALGMTSVLIAEEGGESHLDSLEARAEPDYVIGALSELVELLEPTSAPAES